MPVRASVQLARQAGTDGMEGKTPSLQSGEEIRGRRRKPNCSSRLQASMHPKLKSKEGR